MSTKHTLAALLLVLLVGAIGGLIIFIPLHNSSKVEIAATDTTPPGVPRATYISGSNPLVITHSITGSTHTYTGAVPLSSDCEVVSSSITTMGTQTLTAALELSLLKPDDCIPTATTTVMGDFSASFTTKNAKQKIEFKGVTVNGKDVPVTIKESN